LRYSSVVFYALSKTLDLFASPLTWVLLFALGGPLLSLSGFVRDRFPRLARWSVYLPIVGALVLYVFSIEPVSNALIRSLETPLPASRQRKPDQVYDAVVVLGGLTDDRAALASGLPSYNGASERMHAAFEILREHKAKTLILSGGTMYPESPSEAELLRRQLERWGADLGPVVVEGESRNTKENALFSSRILQEKGAKTVLVVTSAFHLKRALGCFDAVGVVADGYPVDFRGYDPAQSSGTWLPRSGALFDSTWALHEHVGRLVYRLRR
jgi:uncharacterized SAM-binding protein YcdF (DUF218 family)